MKKTLLLAALLTLSGNVLAGTEHYVLRDGNHVQHLKITTSADDIHVTADVDYAPDTNDKDSKTCSAEIIGKAKTVAENLLSLKKHSESEASYCELTISLSPTGAKVQQSQDCDNFVTPPCHFSSGDKELVKIK
ncbi:hypothetical protein [Methylocucumis oryzae]|uniref:Uncharacterized protein n=1 Tax=Methylocucumis oryzae TaxID=1632867 RepID=A0A0F3IG97_9GAMM|nr:hypothetical protein [Methylocucumis oryzae]KJV05776.1 hypothetical protein VZ94_15650 [Methylocucumis oryzae]